MSDQPDQEHSDQGLADLFERHVEGLGGAVRGILGPAADVQEVLQEAFLRALRARRKASTAPRDPVAWMFVVTLNVARDQRRKRLRRGPSVPLEDVDPMHLPSTEAGQGAGLENHEALRAARLAIQGLDAGMKEVFLLRVSAGLPFETIARTLDIPLGTAKTRMRRALAELRRNLADHAPATRPEIGGKNS